jgi:hypothetical protein
MAITNTTQEKISSNTDALINGLFAGIGAGLAMLLFLLTAGLFTGDGTAVTLSRLSSSVQPTNPLSGAFLHLGTSAIYGGLYGFLLRFVPEQRKTAAFKLSAGLVYGLFLFVLANTIILPASQSTLAELSTIVFGGAHVIYGLVLGGLARI